MVRAPPPGSPGYFVQVDDDAWGLLGGSPAALALHRGLGESCRRPRSRGRSTMPVAPFDSDLCAYSRNCIPQRGTTAKVDAMADRLMYRLQYRNFGTHESLVVNHTVDADGTDHAGVRWYEIRDPRNAPVGSPAGHLRARRRPSLDGQRRDGRVGQHGARIQRFGRRRTAPSIRYTGRLATDPPGAMTQGEADIITGGGAQTHDVRPLG